MTTAAPERRRVRSRTTLGAVQAELAERRLSRFIRDAWHVVEPGTAYQHNWHIDAICEHLEAVTDFEIQKLVINIPPRHMKSLIVSVFWPAWVWLKYPHRRFLFASYAEKLSIRDSVKTRRVIQSPWYQARWGDRFDLASDQNVKTKFETDDQGFRLATSVGGVSTGEGGDYLVVDDPHNVQEGESEKKREGAVDWWDTAMSSRVNNPLESARLIIMQRVHEEDLSGHLIEQGWRTLCIPSEFEPHHDHVFIGDPKASRPAMRRGDPRTKVGELLWPTRFGPDWIAEKKIELGSYGYAGQHQQRPAAAVGGILKRTWWNYYRPFAWPQVDEVLQSWDCAFKDEDDSDFVVGGLWVRNQARKYLVAMIRAQLDLPGTVAAVRAMSAWAVVNGLAPAHGKLIEDKANGPAVIQTLKREIPGLIAVNPEGDKIVRAHAAAPTLEAGDVFLPEAAIPCPLDPAVADPEQPEIELPRWTSTPTQDLVLEAASFPKGANDDMVDMFSQAMVRFGGRGRKRKARVRGKRKASGGTTDR